MKVERGLNMTVWCIVVPALFLLSGPEKLQSDFKKNENSFAIEGFRVQTSASFYTESSVWIHR